MQNNASPQKVLIFQSPKNDHHFEQPEKITISQISNSQKITRAPCRNFFQWGKCYISDLEKKIGRSGDNGEGGSALKRLIFANLSQKTSGGF